MNLIEQALFNLLQVLADDFVTKHRELGMKATGDWERSVEVQVKDFSGWILANEYSLWLIQGRRPGTLPPINPIERWVKAKFGDSEDSRNIAWAVATKIKNEGTNYYPEGTDLLDGVLTDQRANEIFEKLGAQVNLIIAEDLQRDFKEAFV